jgi:hypothetical protein
MKAYWAKKKKIDEHLASWKEDTGAKFDMVNHPPHYTSHPSGVECIQVTQHMNFCLGNAMKYLWRGGNKGDYIEDLRKAKWYIEQEIARVGE